ncbi:hypothetical protein GCM10009092_05600 [Bowmanella denitrificans]|uniref:Chitinase n=1 Tax=Bowmanella denitrificans TaxID=366582 RepID=A0ABN0WQH9_9ALTE
MRCNLILSCLLFLLSGCGGGSADNTSKPTSPTVNQSPLISAINLSVIEGEQVTLAPNVSDQDGHIVSYAWTQVAGPQVEADANDKATLSFTAPAIDTPVEILFELAVTDNQGATSKGTMTVKLNLNPAPSVDVANTDIYEETSLTVSALASDANGSVVSYVWEQLGGPSVSNLLAENSQLSFITPSVNEDSLLTFKVTVTDNQGKTASDEFTVLVKSVDNLISIRGKMSEEIFALSAMTLTVGEQSYYSDASADGSYQFILTQTDSNKHELVTLHAKAPSPYQKFDQAAVLGLVSDLHVQATRQPGAPSSYTASLNAVSTAIYQLYNQARGLLPAGAQPTEITALIPAADILPSALFMQLLLGDVTQEYFEMLSPHSDDLSVMAGNRAITATFLAHTLEYDSSLYIQALSELFAAPQVKQILPEADINSVYYLFDTPESLAGSGGRLSFNQDGSGTFLFNKGEVSFHWEKNAQSLLTSVLPEQMLSNERYCKSYQDRTLQLCDVQVEQLSLIQLALPGGQPVLLVHVATRETLQQSPDLSTTEQLRPLSFSANTRAHKDLTPPSEALKLDVEYSLPIQWMFYETTQGNDSYAAVIQSLHIRLNGDWQSGGTIMVSYPLPDSQGVSHTQEASGRWLIQADGTLELAFETDSFFKALNIALLTDPHGKLQANVIIPGTYNIVASGRMVERIFDKSALDLERFAGIYQWPTTDDRPLDHFWFELAADGSATTYQTFDFDENGVLEDGETTEMPGAWLIDESGNIVVRRYRYNRQQTRNNRYCQPASFAPSVHDTCILYHERVLDILSEESDALGQPQLYISHQHKFFNNHNLTGGDAEVNEDKIFDFTFYSKGLLKVKQPPLSLTGQP